MKAPNKKPLGRPPVQQEGLPTSQHILFIASKLFMEKGFESVSMNMVAQHSGVTKASVYYYFPTKNELFVASMVAVLVNVRQRIETLLAQPGSFRERLELIAQNYLRVPQIHMDDMAEKVKHHLTEEQHNQLNQHENALYEALETGFADAARQGEIHCDDPFLTAHLYVSMLRIGERLYSNNAYLFETHEEAAAKIVAFLWRGIHK
ncbi:TetR/AcrR family transcriptional regulator [Paenibacillus woosongensis]|uniref:TetR/AcrR family transcriptional regulator n=1 Tax=Paenibacillus woosongensis TaxID=307580 RepID=A0AA95I427_9BACL|nr:TetR/AcrR family transcriptional regulator [Paenibacillus woosongensis]WHX48466.1 TetR/AcrR family transcriptional regulator [Paenibacillus woosongensis]